MFEVFHSGVWARVDEEKSGKHQTVKDNAVSPTEDWMKQMQRSRRTSKVRHESGMGYRKKKGTRKEGDQQRGPEVW